MIIISMLFVVISVLYYNQVIEQANTLRPIEHKINDLSAKVFKSNDKEEIIDLLKQIYDIEHKYEDSMHIIYNAFILIEILCYFNLMFFLSQLLQFIFLKKTERTYAFPTISLFTDILLFIVSIVNIIWVYYEITWNTHHANLTPEE